MADFPEFPIDPAEFFETFLPRAFAEGDVPHDVREVEFTLGVQLDGHGGGEWIFEVREGELAVESGSRHEADFTIVQSVEDWRGALWEGRGGAIGKQAAKLFRPGQRAEASALGSAPSPAALGRLQGLEGLVLMVVSGGEGGDWQVAFKLGPGPIPDEATTTVTISAADADALERGELNPLEAFMAGRIQVAGDIALMMQMQAAQMQAAADAAVAGDDET